MLPPPPDPAADPLAAPAPAGELREASPPRGHLLWWVSAGIIVADQIAKALVRTSLALFDAHPLVPGVVDLVHVRNYGVAFGLLNNTDLPFRSWITTGLAGAALAGIALYARHLRQDERLARLGLSLILGGAVGNLFDRIRQGFVIDFVDVYWHTWHFWAFNVADASITIGAILVFLDLLLVRRHASHSV